MNWLIVGASRGIGLEFVQQLLCQGHIVIATARAPSASVPKPSASRNTSKLNTLTCGLNGRNLTILECDVSDEQSIKGFAEQVKSLATSGGVLEEGVVDCVVLNAGVLEYPNRISEITFTAFAQHMNTNAIGPLVTAQHLLGLSEALWTLTDPTSLEDTSPTSAFDIRNLIFISSDSGSAQNFRSFEDGFGAYAASKAALNQGLRHLAAELHRKAIKAPGELKAPVVLAIHPGEVMTDMAANVSLGWDVEGSIEVEESVRCMLKVIREKGRGGEDEGGMVSSSMEGRRAEDGEASFWTWEGNRYPW